MSECLLYYIKDGCTNVGSAEFNLPQDIKLYGSHIDAEHCKFEVSNQQSDRFLSFFSEFDYESSYYHGYNLKKKLINSYVPNHEVIYLIYLLILRCRENHQVIF